MKLKKIQLSIIVSSLLALMFVLIGCSSCMRAEWKKVYDAYMSDPEGYQTIKAFIRFNMDNVDTTMNCRLEVDAEDYEEHYKTDECFLLDSTEKWRATLQHYNKEIFVCIEINLKILKENGFFDAVEENTVVTIQTHRYYGWIGWHFPILGVEIGDKTYLDFETGKNNWLNYMKEQMK